jgi:hypothetical protein
MSEYQFYEFRAIERPLGKEAMAEMRRVSSRGEITSTSFLNEYHWGDFKGDPNAWIDRFFDAFLYYANWGNKTFILKLPKALLSKETVWDYCSDEGMTVRSTQEHTVIRFSHEPYEPPNTIDYTMRLGSLIGLWDELARGDLRCLYLGWLIDRDWDPIEDEETEDHFEDEEDRNHNEYEPPIPAGLNQLTAAQLEFVDFFDIDQDLLAAAATASPAISNLDPSAADLHQWVSNLPESEKVSHLLKVLGGTGHSVGRELQAKFQKETGVSPKQEEPTRRRVEELQALKRAIRENRMRIEQEVKAAATKERLDLLAARLPSAWDEVEALINTKKVNEYHRAIDLLKIIKELSERGGVPDYRNRVAEIRARHTTKRSFLNSLTRAGL